mgnify:CR=1 FL=1
MAGQEGEELPQIALIGLDGLDGEAAFMRQLGQPPLFFGEDIGSGIDERRIHRRISVPIDSSAQLRIYSLSGGKRWTKPADVMLVSQSAAIERPALGELT